MGRAAGCGCATCTSRTDPARPTGTSAAKAAGDCGCGGRCAAHTDGHGGMTRESASRMGPPLSPRERPAPGLLRSRFLPRSGVYLPPSGQRLPTTPRPASRSTHSERSLRPDVAQSFSALAATIVADQQRKRPSNAVSQARDPKSTRIGALRSLPTSRQGTRIEILPPGPMPSDRFNTARNPGRIEEIDPSAQPKLPRAPDAIAGGLDLGPEESPGSPPSHFACPVPQLVSLAPATATVADYLRWGDACGINLGPNPGYGQFLSPADNHLLRVLTPTELRFLRDHPPDMSAFDVLDRLLPELTDRFGSHASTFSRQAALDLLELNTDEFPHQGLFFNGAPGALFGEPFALALRMVFAFAEHIDHEPFFAKKCLYAAEQANYPELTQAELYREKLASGAWKVMLFDSRSFGCSEKNVFEWPVFQMVAPWRVSFLTRAWRGTTTASTPHRTARICPPYSGQCLLADYYLFWARRLLHLVAHQRSSNKWDLIMARLCARCAIAEITQLAALLVHEFSHVHGTWFECGAALRVREQSCCHYMIQWVFNTLATASLALPAAHSRSNEPLSINLGDLDESSNRFGIETNWRQRFFTTNCGPIQVRLPNTLRQGNGELLATHGSLFDAHSVDYQYAYLRQCDGLLSRTDTSLTTGSGSAWSTDPPCHEHCVELENSGQTDAAAACRVECACEELCAPLTSSGRGDAAVALCLDACTADGGAP